MIGLFFGYEVRNALGPTVVLETPNLNAVI